MLSRSGSAPRPRKSGREAEKPPWRHHAAAQIHHQPIADGIATREMKTTLLEIDREKEALRNELLSFESSIRS